MKKLILLAVFSVFVFTGIASAQTTLDISGMVRVYPEANNYGYGRITLGSAQKTVNFVDQRMRLFFNFKSGEELGGVWAVELDGRWGDVAYGAARNVGLGLEGDTINVESKNINFWWKPNKDLKLTFGLQGYTDDFRGMIFGGADMAGLKAQYAIDKDSSLEAGYYILSDQNVQLNDALTFIPVTYKRKIGPGTLGVSYMYLQDNGGRSGNLETLNANAGGGSDLRSNRTYVGTNYGGASTVFTGTGSNTTAIYNSAILPAEYTHAHSNYLGLSYTGKAMSDKLTYDAVAFYNVGKLQGVPMANGVPVGLVGNNNGYMFEHADMAINAYALAGMLQYQAGASTIRARYMHASGGRSLNDYNGIVTGNQYSTGADLPLFQDDVFILMRNPNDITHSVALLPDINNQGRGANFYSATYAYDINDKWNAQVGFGWLDAGVTRNASFAAAAVGGVGLDYVNTATWGPAYAGQIGTNVLLSNTGLAAYPPLQYNMSGKGKHMGDELNAKVTYKFNKNFSITGIGAYAFLGGFYDNLYLYSPVAAGQLAGYPFVTAASLAAFNTQLYDAAGNYNSVYPNVQNTGLLPKDLYRLQLRFSYNF